MKTVRLNFNSSLYSERLDLAEQAAGGITDVLTLQGLKPNVISGGANTAGAISDFEGRHYDESRRQLNLGTLLVEFANRTDLAGETADFLLTDRDMFAEGTNFVFGITRYDWQLSIQSAARFISYTSDRSMQGRLVRNVARHEYAHMAGMNSPADYANPDMRDGLYRGHCANTCTMRQSMSVAEAVQQVRQLEGSDLAGFCGDCAVSLARKAEND